MRYVEVCGETFPEDALDVWFEDEDDEEQYAIEHEE